MPHYASNNVLQQVVIDLSTSLLQYLGDCWLWTGNEATSRGRAVIEQLAARQKDHIGRLVNLLAQRQPTVELGLFPAEFSGLHYVSLGFVRERLIADEQSIIASVVQALDTCSQDDEAAEVVGQILTEARENLIELQQLQCN